jgi:hypothetical protein
MFSALVWLDNMGSFANMSKDGDGIITRDEVKARAIGVSGVEVADLVVESVMGVADLNGNPTITPIETMVVRFVVTDILDHVATNEELCAMNAGKRPSHVDVKRVVSQLHTILAEDGTGKITSDEAMSVLGEVRRINLLI